MPKMTASHRSDASPNEIHTLKENALCLDASVLVGYCATDEKNEQVDRFMDIINDDGGFIYAPSIVQFEFARAMRRKEFTGRMLSADVDKGIVSLFNFPLLLVWNYDIVTKSMLLCRQGFTNLYDAAFVAVALIKKIPLITEDRDMLKRARLADCRVFTVGEWLDQHG